jgi:uncharacterized FlaG/YvyC family protein
MKNTKYVNTVNTTTGEIDMENVPHGGLKVVKVRDVVAKLVDDRECSIVLDDEEVNDMIEDLMSNDMIDNNGNKHQCNDISCADTTIKIIDGHLDKFRDTIKNIPPEKLQEMKEKVRDAIQKDPFLHSGFDNIGIDLDNFENYLGSVEVLTIERRRVYNVYEIKKDSEATIGTISQQ